MLHTQQNIIQPLKKKNKQTGNPIICYNMNLQDVTLNEISQSQKDLILHDSTCKNSSQTHKNRNGGCQWLDRGQNGELLFNGYKVSVRQDEKILENHGTIPCLQLTYT